MDFSLCPKCGGKNDYSVKDVTPDRISNQLIRQAPQGIQGLYLVDISAFTGGGIWSHNALVSATHQSDGVKKSVKEKLSVELSPLVVSSTETAGLDQLFEVDCQPDASVTGVTSQTDAIDVSVSEAANLLGITERSVWRRIRQGKLSSKLIGGKAILTLRQSDIVTRQTDTKNSRTDQPTDVSVISSSSTDGAHTIELLAEFATKLEAATYRNGYLEAQLDAHKEQIKLLPDYQSKAMEAELLRARVSELEAELESHRHGRLRQFWSWFTGR